MRSVKEILEDIDELEVKRQKSGVKAQQIYAKARANKQEELSPTERREFDEAADFALSAKPKLKELRAELEQAQNRNRQIINMERHPSGTVYNQSHYAGDLVLPVNGVLPGERGPRYQPFNRVGKLKAFKTEQAAYDSGQWFKAVVSRVVNQSIDDRAEEHCRNIGLEISNTAYEGSGTAGGYLLPAPVSSAIIEVRERVGVARQVCNVMPTSGDTLTVPKKTGGLTVYIVPEATAITASDKSWGTVGLALQSRKVLSYLSQELSEDALINLVDNIVSEQAYALALQEDDELINGLGTSAYGGILGLLSSIGSAGVSTAAVSSTWAALTMGEVTTAMGLLPDRYYPYEPSIICSHSFYNSVLVRLAFTAGGAMANEVLQGAPNVRSFMGYKVYLTSKMPTATAVSTKSMLFGAFNQACILADRGGIRLQRSDDVKFVEDMIALKAVSRYDMNVHDKGDASNAGAYVALATHA